MSPQAAGPGSVVVVVDEVVVVHGHAGCTMMPTATFKQRSASVAVTGDASLSSSQMHSGSQAPMPTATLSMNRQSLATAPVPVLTGWPQSPWAARAAPEPQIESVSASTSTSASLVVMYRACHTSRGGFLRVRVVELDFDLPRVGEPTQHLGLAAIDRIGERHFR